jgi:hypothetical protein
MRDVLLLEGETTQEACQPPIDDSSATAPASGLPAGQKASEEPPAVPSEQKGHDAQPGDRTHGGQHRQKRNFYSWIFPDRMKKNSRK